MHDAKFLQKENLLAWLEGLSKQYRVLAPREENGCVIFKPFETAHGVCLERDSTASPKQAVFPASEDILHYTHKKDPDDPSRVEIEVREPDAPEPTIVFGARPCGARGFEIFDPVFLRGQTRDEYYAARREITFFVSLACATVETTCFCHWTGGGPADETGSDVLLTPVSSGWVVEAVSPKGQTLLSSELLSGAGTKAEEAEQVKIEAMASLGPTLDFSKVPKKLLSLFDDMEFWEDVSAKCLSCGVCTYLCPTCYCFNITDETRGLSGRRLRTWDNCMSYQFTLEASGHNPRPTKAHRFKNRIGHKFSYYPSLHGGVSACSGCGRCIKSCPMGVDVREILERVVQYRTQKEELSNV